MRSRRRFAAFVSVGLLAAASIASAQRIWVGGGGFWRTPPRWATKANFDGSFNYCRGYYTSNRREAGGGADGRRNPPAARRPGDAYSGGRPERGQGCLVGRGLHGRVA